MISHIVLQLSNNLFNCVELIYFLDLKASAYRIKQLFIELILFSISNFQMLNNN